MHDPITLRNQVSDFGDVHLIPTANAKACQAVLGSRLLLAQVCPQLRNSLLKTAPGGTVRLPVTQKGASAVVDASCGASDDYPEITLSNAVILHKITQNIIQNQ